MSEMIVRPDRQAPAVILRNFLEGRTEQLAKWVRGRVDPASLVRFALLEYAKSKQLQECSHESIYLSLIACAQVGLEPSGIKQEAFIVPFKGQATFMPGYRGLIKLALRSGAVKSLAAHVVYEADEFAIDLGTNASVVHRVALTERGKAIGTYSLAKLSNGEFDVEWMPIEELEKIRKSAQRGDRESPAYSQWTDQMYRKAPIRRLCKRLPMGEDYYLAATLDETAEGGDLRSYRQALNVDPEAPSEDSEQDSAATPRGTAAVKARLAARQEKQTAAAPSPSAAAAATPPAPASAGTAQAPAQGVRGGRGKKPEQVDLPAVPDSPNDPDELAQEMSDIAKSIDQLPANPHWLDGLRARINKLPPGAERVDLAGRLDDAESIIAQGRADDDVPDFGGE